MLIGRSGQYSVISLNSEEILVTDGNQTWLSPAQASSESIPQVHMKRDGAMQLQLDDTGYEATVGQVSHSRLLQALHNIAREYVQQEKKLEDALILQAEMRSDKLKLRRELSNSIPVEPASQSGIKKGGSLLNPSRSKPKRAKTTADPFGDEE